MPRYIDAMKLTAEFDKCLWGKEWDKALARACVDTVPTADVRKVRYGKWRLRESDGYTREFYYCSRCKGEALQDGDDEDALSAYCPNCGAKMEVPDDDE